MELCYYCQSPVGGIGQKHKTEDHIIPISKNGINHGKNKVICCYGCNQMKADKTLEEFLVFVESKIPKGNKPHPNLNPNWIVMASRIRLLILKIEPYKLDLIHKETKEQYNKRKAEEKRQIELMAEKSKERRKKKHLKLVHDQKLKKMFKKFFRQ